MTKNTHNVCLHELFPSIMSDDLNKEPSSTHNALSTFVVHLRFDSQSRKLSTSLKWNVNCNQINFKPSALIPDELIEVAGIPNINANVKVVLKIDDRLATPCIEINRKPVTGQSFTLEQDSTPYFTIKFKNYVAAVSLNNIPKNLKIAPNEKLPLTCSVVMKNMNQMYLRPDRPCSRAMNACDLLQAFAQANEQATSVIKKCRSILPNKSQFEMFGSCELVERTSSEIQTILIHRGTTPEDVTELRQMVESLTNTMKEFSSYKFDNHCDVFMELQTHFDVDTTHIQTLLKTRSDVLSDVKSNQRSSQKYQLKVNNRVLYLALQNLDLALVRNVNRIIGNNAIEPHYCGNVHLAYFSLRKLLCANERNSIKIDTKVMECVTNIMQLSHYNQDISPCSQSVVPWVASELLSKIVSHLNERAPEYKIATSFLHSYNDKAALTCEDIMNRYKNLQASIRDCKSSTLEESDARDFFGAMVTHDYLNRIVPTPVYGFLMSTMEDNVTSRVCKSRIEAFKALFDEDFDPIINLMFYGTASRVAYGFLRNTSIRSGYNENVISDMIIDTMLADSEKI